MSSDLKVYWRPGCSSCVKVKEFLKQQGVEFESIDVAARPEAMQDLLVFGVKTVPVVARGGEFVFAQALEDVSRFIGREFSARRLEPEVLISRWLHILRAAQRHARQIPATRLRERAVHNRDRSIRDLAYHVYQIPDAFLQALEDGVEDLTAVYNAPPPAAVKTVEDVAAYGAQVEKKLDSVVERACRQVVPPHGQDLLRRASAARAARALHLALGAARAPDHLGARAPGNPGERAAHGR